MAQHDRKFVWPPSAGSATVRELPAETVRGSQPDGSRIGGEPSRLRAAILDFERTWLGLTAPPLRDRMAAADWSPDQPESYCQRCGTTVGPHDADDTGCSTCRGRKLSWQRIVRLGAFSGLLREMVLEVKFTRWRRLGDDLGRMLGESLAPAIEAAELSRDRTALVPVPISTRRRLSRGIDHSTVIARGIGAVTGLTIAHALTRKHRPPQSRLPASARQSNITGTILPRAGVDLGGWNVIVVDDVTTTRATLTAACRAVNLCRKSVLDKGQGVLWAAVLGVTPERGQGSFFKK